MYIFYLYLFLFCYGLQAAHVAITADRMPRPFPTEQEHNKRIKLLPSPDLQAQILEFMKVFGRALHSQLNEETPYVHYKNELLDCCERYGAVVVNLPFVAPPVWTEVQQDLCEGFTVLSYAACSPEWNVEDLELLLNIPGIDVNVQNREKSYEGSTALMFAVKSVDKFEALLARGADLFIKDKKGDSVFEYARHKAPILIKLMGYLHEQQQQKNFDLAISLAARKVQLYYFQSHINTLIDYIKKEEEEPTEESVQTFDDNVINNLSQMRSNWQSVSGHSSHKAENPESKERTNEQEAAESISCNK